MAENNWASYVSEKHYEVARYFTVTEHAIQKARAEGCVITYLSKEETKNCKELKYPLYEKYCSEFMDLIEEIQSQN